MKVLIDIPKEFENDLQDKFNEFFERVKCDIDSSLSSQEISMCGNYERETTEMFLSAFEKAIVIPDGATNGDMIKIIFPDSELRETMDDLVHYTLDGYVGNYATKDWWNALYKKEVE